MRILTVLGQRPGDTGSGTLVKEFIRYGEKFGDEHYLINLDYRELAADILNSNTRSIIFASLHGEEGDLDFPIPGMSDSMPYKSVRYADMTAIQITKFLEIFRAKIDAGIQSFQPDILHIHHLWLLVSLARYYRLPVITTIHGSDIKLLETAPHLRSLVLEGINNINRFISVSHMFADSAVRCYGIPKDKISVVWNGFNAEVFNVQRGREVLSSVPIILYAGKFVGWKGIKYLIRACSQIDSPYHLIIAGEGDQSITLSLLQEVSFYKMDGRTQFVGQLSQERLASIMRAANVFVLPSINEPFGLVILEALACGCPVVTSNSGGPAEFIPKLLVEEGFVELIPALQDNTECSEQNYVAYLAEAIRKKLTLRLSVIQRQIIYEAIRHLTWENYYSQIRRIYEYEYDKNAQQENQPDQQ